MPKWLRILLGCGLLCLGSSLAAWLYFKRPDPKTVAYGLDEGARYAAKHDANGCVDKARDMLGDVLGRSFGRYFLRGCLQNAARPPDFCEKNAREDLCRKGGYANDDDCRDMAEEVTEFCRSTPIPPG